MRVVLADIDRPLLDQAVSELTTESLDVAGVPTDVADFVAVQRLAGKVYDKYGATHLLHLNAGVATPGSFFDDVTEDWDQVIGVNLKGVIWGIKAFVPRMLAGDEEGFVLATSSGSGAEGTSYAIPGYASTKMAIVSLMECLYGQLAEQSSKLQTGVLLPPLTATNIAGDVAQMHSVEARLRASGIPATVVQPHQVALMALDGVKRGRFFIRPIQSDSAQFFDGALADDFFEWNERMIRGRAMAAINGTAPNGYLW
jgi:NAD(P)-dependent dehydrogenase (short-subunit alcohol dehydrogenase family)